MILLAVSEGPEQGCGDAQVELSLHCLHMPEDMFLHSIAMSLVKVSLKLGSLNMA